ncbi:MAG TPA: TM0106 family RecB-like putative nuclease [Gammaproteobacteria bacterium]|nr:TM0106 family RecB-like putative nuclease [Gammaproteobacteria bacterium]
MRRDPKTREVRFSPTDLVNFTRSPFLSWMDRRLLDDPALAAELDKPDPLLTLLARRGGEHESDYLAALRDGGLNIIALDRENTGADTLEAIEGGADVIYQACLENGPFGGYADFLKRSADGSGYEVWDTKLSKHVKPEYLIQLCAYVDMLEHMTGERILTAGVILGDGSEVRFHVPEYFDYYSYKRDEFLAFMALCEAGAPRPEPEIGADHGRWSGAAERLWLASDHLVQVANITRRQINCLKAAGITTLEGLANTRKRRVTGIDPARFARLHSQAALQLATRLSREADPQATPAWALLEPDECRPGLGFAALPAPDPEGDVYFDIEGDPMQDERLEYLLGVSYVENGERQFRAFWAHSFDEERKSFTQFMEWILGRRCQHPDMHIYHYAAYENAALKALASRHDVYLDEVDTLLRESVLVDLYSVVRNALRIGEPNYSLKSVEHLYLGAREGEVTTAGDSVIQYDRYRQLCGTDDAESREAAQKILDEIMKYNRLDCDSTLELADWLRANQPEVADSAAEDVPDDDDEAAEAEERPLSEKAARRRALQQALRDHALLLREKAATSNDAVCKVLADVLNYHEREAKPIWWRYFELKDADADELHDAGDAIAAARFESCQAVGGRSRSSSVTFSFDPEQDCEFKVGDRAEVIEWQDEAGWGADGEITELEQSGHIKLKITNKKLAARVSPDELPPVTIVLKPNPPDPTGFLVRLLELAQAALADKPVPPALRRFVERAKPPVANATPGVVTEGGINADEIARRLAEASDFALCVQGPPGTGKTHSFARIAARLVESGKRVGMVAGSHEVVRNFVRAVGKAAEDIGGERKATPLFCQFKGNDRNELEEAVPCATAFKWEEWHEDARFVAGTHFFFAREDAVCEFDYLFVDEAGQFALADLVALSPVARSLVLIGDPQQLPQVIQGSHPGCGGQSCLEYALDGADVLAEDQGLFLPVTYRLRPEICAFVSDLSYASRLHPASTTKSRVIDAVGGGPAELPTLNGLVYLPVEHDGNCQDSPEEAELIADLTDKLIGTTFRDGDRERPLTIDDFLYVSPYNLQVRRLRDILPSSARVGSVNLFQGQQAAVVFVSLCASPGEFGPRGLGFILDRNRLNVAVSRAQCLAIVVGNPGLLAAPAKNPENIRQLNVLARLIRSNVTRSPPVMEGA